MMHVGDCAIQFQNFVNGGGRFESFFFIVFLAPGLLSTCFR